MTDFDIFKEAREIQIEIFGIIRDNLDEYDRILDFDIPNFHGKFSDYKSAHLDDMNQQFFFDLDYFEMRVRHMQECIEKISDAWMRSEIAKWIEETEERIDRYGVLYESFVDDLKDYLDNPIYQKTPEEKKAWKNQSPAPKTKTVKPTVPKKPCANQTPAPKKKPVKPLVQKLIYQKQYPIPTPPKKRTIIENIIRHARIIFEQLFKRTFTF